MHRQARIDRYAKMPQRHAQTGHRQPAIRQVQRPQQRHVPEGAIMPAHQPHQMPCCQHGEQQAHPQIGLKRESCGIGQRHQGRTDQQQPIQPRPGGNAFNLAEAALNEERNHAPADQAHHRRHQPKAGQHALTLPAFMTF
ncbi:hypothetical protein D3C85_1419690 [compost metagenome]